MKAASVAEAKAAHAKQQTPGGFFSVVKSRDKSRGLDKMEGMLQGKPQPKLVKLHVETPALGVVTGGGQIPAVME